MNKQRKLPFRFSEIGRWWGKVTQTVDGRKRTDSEEIDIVAADKNEERFIIGECKFRTELFDNGELRKLKEKLGFPGDTYYYLFSLSGFTETVIKACEADEKLFLVDVGQIVNVM